MEIQERSVIEEIPAGIYAGWSKIAGKEDVYKTVLSIGWYDCLAKFEYHAAFCALCLTLNKNRNPFFKDVKQKTVVGVSIFLHYVAMNLITLLKLLVNAGTLSYPQI